MTMHMGKPRSMDMTAFAAMLDCEMMPAYAGMNIIPVLEECCCVNEYEEDPFRRE